MNAKFTYPRLQILVAIGVLLLLAACAQTAAPAATQPTIAPAATVAQPTSAPQATSATVKATKEAAAGSSATVGTCNIDPPTSPTTINMLGWPFSIMNFYADTMKECGQVKNLTVNVQMLDFTAVDDSVRLALSGGGASPYDIVHGSNPEMIEFGSQGWLLPLNDLIEKYKTQYQLDDIMPEAWAGATIDGKIYGIPVDLNTLHLFYREDLFSKYNLKVPTTYDEVIANCKALKADPDLDIPFAMDVSAGWAWEIEFFSFIRSFGGDYLNPDNTPAFNSPAGVAAATKMKEVVDACMGGKAGNYGYEAYEAAMGNGSIAFTQDWANAGSLAIDPKKWATAGSIKFAPGAAPNPGGKLDGSSWFDYYYIPKNTKVDPDLIFRVIMEAAKAENMQQAAKLGFITRKSIPQQMPNSKEALETIQRGSGAYPTNRAITLAQAALGNWLPFVGDGSKTPKEALDGAAAEYIEQAKKQGFIK